MNTLTKQQFEQKFANRPEALVIDVLDMEFYNNEHIPGAINIPAHAIDFMEQVQAAARKDQPIVVYCSSIDCTASENAARKLEEEGFTKVYDLAGGIDEWKEQGGRLESNVPGAVD